MLSPLLLINLVFILDLINDLTWAEVLGVGQARLQVRNGNPESVGKLSEFIAYDVRKFFFHALIIFQFVVSICLFSYFMHTLCILGYVKWFTVAFTIQCIIIFS